MTSCETPSKEMLPCGVHLLIDSPGLDFHTARRAAYDAASSCTRDPMLVSWYDKKARSYSPGDVNCCRDGKPSWLSYAESRGADFAVDVNDEDFVFLFRDNSGDC